MKSASAAVGPGASPLLRRLFFRSPNTRIPAEPMNGTLCSRLRYAHPCIILPFVRKLSLAAPRPRKRWCWKIDRRTWDAQFACYRANICIAKAVVSWRLIPRITCQSACSRPYTSPYNTFGVLADLTYVENPSLTSEHASVLALSTAMPSSTSFPPSGDYRSERRPPWSYRDGEHLRPPILGGFALSPPAGIEQGTGKKIKSNRSR